MHGKGITFPTVNKDLECRYRQCSSNGIGTFRAMLSTPFEQGCRHLSSRADGIICFYRFNLVRRPRRTVKNGFADIVWSSVRLQFCISKTAVNKILGTKRRRLKSSFSSFRWAAENILWKIQRNLRPPAFAVQTRIKTLG